MRIKGYDDPLILKTLTMIDPETGYFKIIKYNDKHASTIVNLEYSKRCYGYNQSLQ